MIRRDFRLTVSGETSKLDKPFYIYRGDFGIEVAFSIIGLNYNFDGVSTDIVKNYKPTYSNVRYKKPNGDIYENEVVSIDINDNKVRFTITKEMTDELSEIGDHKVQIRLYDAYNNVLTIPAFNFEVKPLIDAPLEVDVDTIDNNITDAGSEPITDPTNPDYGNDLENRIYNIKDWIPGEVVRSFDLNRMEEAINYLVVNGVPGQSSGQNNIYCMSQEEYDNLENVDMNAIYIII